LLTAASIVIPLCIFGGSMYWIYRRSADSRAQRGISDRTTRAVFQFTLLMAAILLVIATAVGHGGAWFLVWLVIVLAGNLLIRRLVH
jgi:hypothetical protein